MPWIFVHEVSLEAATSSGGLFELIIPTEHPVYCTTYAVHRESSYRSQTVSTTAWEKFSPRLATPNVRIRIGDDFTTF